MTSNPHNIITRPYALVVGCVLALAGCTINDDVQRDLPLRPALGKPVDRMGRALTGNALLGTIAAEEMSDALKESYNRADQSAWQQFAPDIGRNLALYDSFDVIAGNQWLVDTSKDSEARYQALAKLLADDRLWVDTASAECTQYLAVEMAAHGDTNIDCGGRTPNHNVNGVFRSLLIRGASTTVDDGVDHDDKAHSIAVFPFLAEP